jgi:hypothetical protein
MDSQMGPAPAGKQASHPLGCLFHITGRAGGPDGTSLLPCVPLAALCFPFVHILHVFMYGKELLPFSPTALAMPPKLQAGGAPSTASGSQPLQTNI